MSKVSYEYEWHLEEHVYYNQSYNGNGFEPASSDIEATHIFSAHRNDGELRVMLRWLAEWHQGEPSDKWVPDQPKGSANEIVGYEISLVCRKYGEGRLLQQGYAYVDQSNWTLDKYFVDARDCFFQAVPKHYQIVLQKAMPDRFDVFRNLSNAYVMREQNGNTHKMNVLNQPSLADL